MIFSKLKELSKDTAVYGISTMLGRFLNFLLVPFYTHVFVPGEYGIVSNIYAVVALLNIIYLYGMDSAFMKYAANKEDLPEKEVFSTPFLSVLFTSFIFSLLVVLAQEPILYFLGIPSDFKVLIYFIAVILFVDALSAIPFIKLRLERKAKKFAFYKVLNIVINVVLNIILVLILEFGIEAVFISNLVASVFTLLLLSGEIKKYLKFELNKEIFKKLLKFGIPYLPAGFASIIIQVIDRPILEHLTDLHTVGIYQANHKLGIFMMLFVNMFQFAWQPFFLQNAKEERAKEIFSKVLTYFTLIGSLILVFLSLFISDIVQLKIFGRSLIGPAYWSGLFIVPVVLLGYLFNGLYFVFTAGVFIKEKTIYIPFITALAAGLNIGGNLLLIPYFGIMGSAIAALLSYITMALSLFVVTQFFYKIEYELAKIAKIFFLVFLVTAAYFWLLYTGNLLFIYKIVLMLGYIIMLLIYIVDKEEYLFLRTKLMGNKNV
jgi:O-antigen/teichoic acid export membrane protein